MLGQFKLIFFFVKRVVKRIVGQDCPKPLGDFI